MKYCIKTSAKLIVTMLALASFQTARADILTVTNDSQFATWDAVAGTTAFYTNNLGSLSVQGPPGSGAGPYEALSETFTITNNAEVGLTGTAGNSNYVLNAIAIVTSGGATPVSMHLFDITTNLSSTAGTWFNNSSATYNFTANGDLFGNGFGLSFSNDLAVSSGSENQEFIVLENGANGQDQVVLAAGHSYALEFWMPKSGSTFGFAKDSVADGYGQAMASKDAGLANPRVTLAAYGLVGGAPRTFAIALYGAPTTAPLSVNGSTNTPAQITYTEDDFNTNGVNNDPNGPGYDYYAAGGAEPYDVPGNIGNVWAEFIGSGVTGITFDPNVNVSGNTNQNGAMALNLDWTGEANGYEQFAITHGNTANSWVPTTTAGTTGIGYPQYTNVECDVMFDPSSAGTTNSAGVLGVIRLGLRGYGAFGQDWQPTADYTTISDTNWHHLTMALTSTDPTAQNIGDVIIGEDVNAYVGGGGLTGNQILYVDNVRFTGPTGALPAPPTVVNGPIKVSPGLRMFAGTGSTIDRALVYTVDQEQTWVGASAGAPVSYTFSLQDYNPNIEEVVAELIGGGTTPTTYGEYADYSGPTTLWLELNPGPSNSQVVATVAWKINDPGANPTNAATVFTNSTAVGTWSLVFTGPGQGYVVAPGSVINGSTNFTITDPNVSTDFGNPLFAAFGLQPNTTAGLGEYVDWGSIGITNVVDGNEYENFATESSDFFANFSPTLEFDNSMSGKPAAVLIQTTNDAYWLNWNSPAIGMTLASITNLTATNWINPGWYSEYTDTNAPRVMPLAAPFGNNFWVLLPKDDLPTANGQQNSSPPAAGAPAPYSFFRLSTGTVSP
jgi:hypothetical protein